MACVCVKERGKKWKRKLLLSPRGSVLVKFVGEF